MAARTAITPQIVTRAGIQPTYAAADSANGMSFVNDGKTELEIKNAAGASMTVTALLNQSGPDGLAVTNRVATVPATTGVIKMGPFPTQLYNQTDGSVYVDISSATSVTIAAFRIA